MNKMLDRVDVFIGSSTYARLCSEHYFGDGVDFRRRDVWKFLDGVAASDDELRDEGAARRLIFNLCDIYSIKATSDAGSVRDKIKQLRTYFNAQYAGQKDVKEVQ